MRGTFGDERHSYLQMYERSLCDSKLESHKLLLNSKIQTRVSGYILLMRIAISLSRKLRIYYLFEKHLNVSYPNYFHSVFECVSCCLLKTASPPRS